MIKVLVDARVEPGVNGGIEQALIGLVEALATTDSSQFKICWLALSTNYQFIKTKSPADQEIFLVTPRNSKFGFLINEVRKYKAGRLLMRILRQIGPFKYSLPPAPGIIEDIKPDVIHFPLQFGFRTSVPSIYQPHDLQHLHYPQFFSAETLYLRNIAYSEMMNQAKIIAVGNKWTQDDVSRKYPEFAGKVRNIPVSPQTLSSSSLADFAFPFKPFIFYPAAFWPHKNHEIIFRALVLLRGMGVTLNLVLTGAKSSQRKEIDRLFKDFGISNQVFDLGFVSTRELTSLYQQALAMVMPSKFESESLPIWEAFALGCPVITARITALPSQVEDAALLFDPDDAVELANHINLLMKNESLRTELVSKGSARFALLTPENTAKAYTSAYLECLGALNPTKPDEIFTF